MSDIHPKPQHSKKPLTARPVEPTQSRYPQMQPPLPSSPYSDQSLFNKLRTQANKNEREN